MLSNRPAAQLAGVAIPPRSAAYRVGWTVLFGLSALSVASYIALIFIVPAMVDSFIAWATFSLYSAIVLLIPYRRVERWAWYVTWALPVPSVVLALNNPDAAPYYLTAAGLMAIGQFLTRTAFFSRSRKSPTL
jgi:hypothetical protein